MPFFMEGYYMVLDGPDLRGFPVPGVSVFCFTVFCFTVFCFTVFCFTVSQVQLSRQKQVKAPSRMKSEPVVKVEVSPAR